MYTKEKRIDYGNRGPLVIRSNSKVPSLSCKIKYAFLHNSKKSRYATELILKV